LAFYKKKDAKLLFLNAPAIDVEFYGSKSHGTHSQYVRKLTTEFFFFDPFKESRDLLDPVIVERYVGYLLGILPFLSIVDDNGQLQEFSKLKEITNSSKRGHRRLLKALAITNLALSQQLILSGEGSFIRSKNMWRDLNSVRDNTLIVANVGLFAAGKNLDNRSEFAHYKSIQNSENTLELQRLVNEWEYFPKGSKVVKTRLVDTDGKAEIKYHVVAGFKDLKIPLPSGNALYENHLNSASVSFDYSPHLIRLVALQDRLVNTIRLFDIQTNTDRSKANIIYLGLINHE